MLPQAARSHDPPMLLPDYTFSMASVASVKQNAAPSPTSNSIVHCFQASGQKKKNSICDSILGVWNK